MLWLGSSVLCRSQIATVLPAPSIATCGLLALRPGFERSAGSSQFGAAAEAEAANEHAERQAEDEGAGKPGPRPSRLPVEARHRSVSSLASLSAPDSHS